MHPTADTLLLKFLQPCGAAGDAGRYASSIAARMNLVTERYVDQLKRWPPSGRHILAQFDGRSVVVYQAYKPSIGHFAARHGYFGGPQLGLRGDALERYAREWVVGIEDVSEFVVSQRTNAHADGYEALETPREEVYPVAEEAVARRLQISAGEA
jgi:hypothetical protein